LSAATGLPVALDSAAASLPCSNAGAALPVAVSMIITWSPLASWSRYQKRVSSSHFTRCTSWSTSGAVL